MRTTISLDNDLYQAVHERAVATGQTLGEVIAQALLRDGVTTRKSAGAALNAEDALQLGVEETRGVPHS